MKKTLHYLIIAFLTISLHPMIAQDKPDGFASVSGKGLETTTGGEGGTVIVAETLSYLLRYANSNKPYIIIVKGQLESTNWRQINVGSNTTIVGDGVDATLKNIGLVMVDEENIIIRNLIIRDSYVEGDWEGKTNDYDGIRADNTHHLWVDHCHLTHLGDGLIDLRKVSDYITISNTKLSNHNKAFGVGWTEETDFRITIHHCWTDDTNQRNPSFDMGMGHLYNNYLSNIASYGNLSRGAARVVVQNSHFYKATNPLKISDEAVLYSSNNTFDNCSGSKSGNVTTMPFNPADYYDYELDPVEQVVELVTNEVGPKQYVSDQYNVPNSTADTYKKSSIQYAVSERSKILSIQSEVQQSVKLSIFSLDGKLVQSNYLGGLSSTQISLESQKKGVYLLQFILPNKIETGKIIIQ